MSEPQGQPFVPQQPGNTGGGQSASKNLGGMFNDAATLVATGLLVAAAFAIFAGFINFLGDPGPFGGLRERIVALTITVDVGDIALLGVAVAMLVLTPDPPGGIPRKYLLWVTAGLSAIITVLGGIRALEVLTNKSDFIFRFAGFVAITGLVIAAATIAFFAIKEASVRSASDAS